MTNVQHGPGLPARTPPSAGRPEVLSRFELTRGESLYRRGDRNGSLYRVEAGLLKLSLPVAAGRERILLLAGPGDVIGALSPHVPAVCTEDAEALSRSVNISLLHSGTDAAAALRLGALARQAEQLRRAFEDAELPVPARLARTLLQLAERFGQARPGGLVRLTLPLTHDNLAAMIGAARETTSCELARLRRCGLISGTRGVYSFRPEQLHGLVPGNSAAD